MGIRDVRQRNVRFVELKDSSDNYFLICNFLVPKQQENQGIKPCSAVIQYEVTKL